MELLLNLHKQLLKLNCNTYGKSSYAKQNFITSWHQAYSKTCLVIKSCSRFWCLFLLRAVSSSTTVCVFIQYESQNVTSQVQELNLNVLNVYLSGESMNTTDYSISTAKEHIFISHCTLEPVLKSRNLHQNFTLLLLHLKYLQCLKSLDFFYVCLQAIQTML